MADYKKDAVRMVCVSTVTGLPCLRRYYDGATRVGDDVMFTGVLTSVKSFLVRLSELGFEGKFEEFVYGQNRFIIKEKDPFISIMVVDAQEPEVGPFYERVDSVLELVYENYRHLCPTGVGRGQEIRAFDNAYSEVDALIGKSGQGTLGRSEPERNHFSADSLKRDINELFRKYRRSAE